MNRTAVATALDGLGVPQLMMRLRRAASPWLTVLTYHRVVQPGDASTYDDGVVDATPDQLERQLGFVKTWFHPIGMDELMSFVRTGSALPKNPILVTFDDGYRDNHDVALPILVRHGIRATFFIATDYVQRRRPFWWDRVARAIQRSSHDRIELTYPAREELPLHDANARRAAARRCQRIIKDTFGLDLERFVDGLETAAGVPLTADDQTRLADETVMNWAHVVALRRAGMDVQSHTRTHRVLQTLDAAQLADELVGSRTVLEDVLGEPVRAISYPVGKAVVGAPPIVRALRDARYELGFSNGTGVNRVRAFDPLDAHRISLDRAIGDRFFRTMLALPAMGY